MRVQSFTRNMKKKNSSETNEKFNWNVIKSFPDFQYYNQYLPELKEVNLLQDSAFQILAGNYRN